MNHPCMDCDSECIEVIIKDYECSYGQAPEVMIYVGDVIVFKCSNCGIMMADDKYADACDAVVKKYLQDKKHE